MNNYTVNDGHLTVPVRAPSPALAAERWADLWWQAPEDGDRVTVTVQLGAQSWSVTLEAEVRVMHDAVEVEPVDAAGLLASEGPPVECIHCTAELGRPSELGHHTCSACDTGLVFDEDDYNTMVVLATWDDHGQGPEPVSAPVLPEAAP